jgi:hypothetical protein
MCGVIYIYILKSHHKLVWSCKNRQSSRCMRLVENRIAILLMSTRELPMTVWHQFNTPTEPAHQFRTQLTSKSIRMEVIWRAKEWNQRLTEASTVVYVVPVGIWKDATVPFFALFSWLEWINNVSEWLTTGGSRRSQTKDGIYYLHYAGRTLTLAAARTATFPSKEEHLFIRREMWNNTTYPQFLIGHRNWDRTKATYYVQPLHDV